MTEEREAQLELEIERLRHALQRLLDASQFSSLVDEGLGVIEFKAACYNAEEVLESSQ